METTHWYDSADQTPPEIVDVGVKRRILGHDTQLMMVKVDFAKGAVGALHNHPHRQVTYVVAGTFTVTIGDTSRVLQPGDSFFVPPDIQHGVVAQEEGILIDVFSPARADFVPGG